MFVADSLHSDLADLVNECIIKLIMILRFEYVRVNVVYRTNADLLSKLLLNKLCFVK